MFYEIGQHVQWASRRLLPPVGSDVGRLVQDSFYRILSVLPSLDLAMRNRLRNLSFEFMIARENLEMLESLYPRIADLESEVFSGIPALHRLTRTPLPFQSFSNEPHLLRRR